MSYSRIRVSVGKCGEFAQSFTSDFDTMSEELESIFSEIAKPSTAAFQPHGALHALGAPRGSPRAQGLYFDSNCDVGEDSGQLAGGLHHGYWLEEIAV
jgi:hypothetical protein